MGDLICFEGPKRVGKDTLILKLLEIKENNIGTVSVVRDSEFPEMMLARKKIREFKVNPNEIPEFLATAREKVWLDYIQPMVNKYDYLILDRWFYTSAVLQSTDTNSVEKIFNINININKGILVPKKTFILYAPVDIILSIIRSRKRLGYERYTRDFILKMIQGYNQINSIRKECEIISTDRDINSSVDYIYK